MARAIVPRCTYRLQLHKEFDFRRATALVPYLAALGVSHVYCSPYLRARAGSLHGYDIIDHGALNPEIGNRDDFDTFAATLAHHGMGQILDMVPNHMGVMGRDNAWWMDLLENGPASVYAEYFDVDWKPLDPEFAQRIVLPVLGDHYGAVLERGELKLEFEPATGSFAVFYFDHRFPVDPREYPRILQRALRALTPSDLPDDARAGAGKPHCIAQSSPPRDATGADAIAERTRDKEVHKRQLKRMAAEHPILGETIERTVRQFNVPGSESDPYQSLHELLDAQAYRLAYWRVAGDDINYRRFFDVNDLAALRMENEAAFGGHAPVPCSNWWQRVRSTACASIIPTDCTTLHAISGACKSAMCNSRSAMPRGHRRKLPTARSTSSSKRSSRRTSEFRKAGSSTAPRAIASPTRSMDFSSTPPRAAGSNAFWKAFVGAEAVSFADAAYRGKRIVLTSALAGELAILTRRLLRLARSDRRTRDYTFNTLQDAALTEIIGSFLIERTSPIPACRSKIDVTCSGRWAAPALKHVGQTRACSISWAACSCASRRAHAAATFASEARSIALRFQQLTAPVTAKGIEDTAFYSYNRLVSLNDVGGDPEQFGLSVDAFHAASSTSGDPMAAHDARHVDARQQAFRGCPRTHRRHIRGARRVAPARAPLESPQSTTQAHHRR